jgi:Putative mono-oxygenase ydhR
MNVLIVTFRLEATAAAEYSRTCEALAPRFAAVPGLISKVWLADPATRNYGGVYTFRDPEALDAYLASDLFASVAGMPGLGEVAVQAFGVLDGPTRVTRGASMAAA